MKDNSQDHPLPRHAAKTQWFLIKSVANSIVGLSQLGNDVGFIGKISDDELGAKYEEGLKKEKVKYFYSKKKEAIPTGTCLILITPDSERTMCTFLGTAGKISENDIDINSVKNSDLLFVFTQCWSRFIIEHFFAIKFSRIS